MPDPVRSRERASGGSAPSRHAVTSPHWPHTAHRTPHTAHRTPHTAHRTPHTAHHAIHPACAPRFRRHRPNAV
ncbi:hypothetical protein CEQ23_34535 [Burkholderia cepacia]|uniref:Uncharacterized protein n=1 Tax=Burkholderia cepacia TaxID=292 RepID=A0ABN5D6X4_BURCE|nr:hypothetical protein CEQ23_34535 [Burkholderia cepacia]ATF83274.1 hypothetical protein CO711_39760 [Burkholderia cepacia]QCY07556.1 hypothetical protein EJ998_31950 [Burkholderia cepacia ATCC 25416]